MKSGCSKQQLILKEGNSLYTDFRQPLAMHTHKLRHYFDTVIIINTAWRYICTQIIALRKWKEFSTVSSVMHSSDTVTFIPFSIRILMIVAFAARPLPLCLPSWSCTLSSIPVIYSELYRSWMLKPLVVQVNYLHWWINNTIQVQWTCQRDTV